MYILTQEDKTGDNAGSPIASNLQLNQIINRQTDHEYEDLGFGVGCLL